MKCYKSLCKTIEKVSVDNNKIPTYSNSKVKVTVGTKASYLELINYKQGSWWVIKIMTKMEMHLQYSTS